MKLAVLILMMTYLTPGWSQTVCGVIPTYFKNNNTCPPRAVCSDVFEMTRDFQNGTTCTETRTTSNCLCLNSEGRGVHLCPIDDDHRIYNLGGHRQYTCEPTCSFPWCGNRTPSPNGPVVATTSEQNSHSFGGKTFTRIECRCPRHHRVNPQASHNQQRATQYAGHRFNTATRHYSTLYSCNFLPHEDISDPCAQ